MITRRYSKFYPSSSSAGGSSDGGASGPSSSYADSLRGDSPYFPGSEVPRLNSFWQDDINNSPLGQGVIQKFTDSPSGKKGSTWLSVEQQNAMSVAIWSLFRHQCKKASEINDEAFQAWLAGAHDLTSVACKITQNVLALSKGLPSVESIVNNIHKTGMNIDDPVWKQRELVVIAIVQNITVHDGELQFTALTKQERAALNTQLQLKTPFDFVQWILLEQEEKSEGVNSPRDACVLALLAFLLRLKDDAKKTSPQAGYFAKLVQEVLEDTSKRSFFYKIAKHVTKSSTPAMYELRTYLLGNADDCLKVLPGMSRWCYLHKEALASRKNNLQRDATAAIGKAISKLEGQRTVLGVLARTIQRGGVLGLGAYEFKSAAVEKTLAPLLLSARPKACAQKCAFVLFAQNHSENGSRLSLQNSTVGSELFKDEKKLLKDAVKLIKKDSRRTERQSYDYINKTLVPNIRAKFSALSWKEGMDIPWDALQELSASLPSPVATSISIPSAQKQSLTSATGSSVYADLVPNLVKAQIQNAKPEGLFLSQWERAIQGFVYYLRGDARDLLDKPRRQEVSFLLSDSRLHARWHLLQQHLQGFPQDKLVALINAFYQRWKEVPDKSLDPLLGASLKQTIDKLQDNPLLPAYMNDLERHLIKRSPTTVLAARCGLLKLEHFLAHQLNQANRNLKYVSTSLESEFLVSRFQAPVLHERQENERTYLLFDITNRSGLAQIRKSFQQYKPGLLGDKQKRKNAVKAILACFVNEQSSFDQAKSDAEILKHLKESLIAQCDILKAEGKYSAGTLKGLIAQTLQKMEPCNEGKLPCFEHYKAGVIATVAREQRKKVVVKVKEIFKAFHAGDISLNTLLLFLCAEKDKVRTDGHARRLNGLLDHAIQAVGLQAGEVNEADRAINLHVLESRGLLIEKPTKALFCFACDTTAFETYDKKYNSRRWFGRENRRNQAQKVYNALVNERTSILEKQKSLASIKAGLKKDNHAKHLKALIVQATQRLETMHTGHQAKARKCTENAPALLAQVKTVSDIKTLFGSVEKVAADITTYLDDSSCWNEATQKFIAKLWPLLKDRCKDCTTQKQAHDNFFALKSLLSDLPSHEYGDSEQATSRTKREIKACSQKFSNSLGLLTSLDSHSAAQKHIFDLFTGWVDGALAGQLLQSDHAVSLFCCAAEEQGSAKTLMASQLNPRIGNKLKIAFCEKLTALAEELRGKDASSLKALQAMQDEIAVFLNAPLVRLHGENNPDFVNEMNTLIDETITDCGCLFIAENGSLSMVEDRQLKQEENGNAVDDVRQDNIEFDSVQTGNSSSSGSNTPLLDGYIARYKDKLKKLVDTKNWNELARHVEDQSEYQQQIVSKVPSYKLQQGLCAKEAWEHINAKLKAKLLSSKQIKSNAWLLCFVALQDADDKNVALQLGYLSIAASQAGEQPADYVQHALSRLTRAILQKNILQNIFTDKQYWQADQFDRLLRGRPRASFDLIVRYATDEELLALMPEALFDNLFDASAKHAFDEKPHSRRVVFHGAACLYGALKARNIADQGIVNRLEKWQKSIVSHARAAGSMASVFLNTVYMEKQFQRPVNFVHCAAQIREALDVLRMASTALPENKEIALIYTSFVQRVGALESWVSRMTAFTEGEEVWRKGVGETILSAHSAGQEAWKALEQVKPLPKDKGTKFNNTDKYVDLSYADEAYLDLLLLKDCLAVDMLENCKKYLKEQGYTPAAIKEIQSVLTIYRDAQVLTGESVSDAPELLKLLTKKSDSVLPVLKAMIDFSAQMVRDFRELNAGQLSTQSINDLAERWTLQLKASDQKYSGSQCKQYTEMLALLKSKYNQHAQCSEQAKALLCSGDVATKKEQKEQKENERTALIWGRFQFVLASTNRLPVKKIVFLWKALRYIAGSKVDTFQKLPSCIRDALDSLPAPILSALKASTLKQLRSDHLLPFVVLEKLCTAWNTYRHPSNTSIQKYRALLTMKNMASALSEPLPLFSCDKRWEKLQADFACTSLLTLQDAIKQHTNTLLPEVLVFPDFEKGLRAETKSSDPHRTAVNDWLDSISQSVVSQPTVKRKLSFGDDDLDATSLSDEQRLSSDHHAKPKPRGGFRTPERQRSSRKFSVSKPLFKDLPSLSVVSLDKLEALCSDQGKQKIKTLRQRYVTELQCMTGALCSGAGTPNLLDPVVVSKLNVALSCLTDAQCQTQVEKLNKFYLGAKRTVLGPVALNLAKAIAQASDYYSETEHKAFDANITSVLTAIKMANDAEQPLADCFSSIKAIFASKSNFHYMRLLEVLYRSRAKDPSSDALMIPQVRAEYDKRCLKHDQKLMEKHKGISYKHQVQSLFIRALYRLQAHPSAPWSKVHPVASDSMDDEHLTVVGQIHRLILSDNQHPAHAWLREQITTAKSSIKAPQGYGRMCQQKANTIYQDYFPDSKKKEQAGPTVQKRIVSQGLGMDSSEQNSDATGSSSSHSLPRQIRG